MAHANDTVSPRLLGFIIEIKLKYYTLLGPGWKLIKVKIADVTEFYDLISYLSGSLYGIYG